MYTWTGKSLPLRVSPSDAPATVHGHRQTHTIHSQTHSHTDIYTTQNDTDTQTHQSTQADTYKHTERHI